MGGRARRRAGPGGAAYRAGPVCKSEYGLMVASGGDGGRMVLAKIPATPGLEGADEGTRQWVEEFLSCFGGRVDARRTDGSRPTGVLVCDPTGHSTPV